jgi:hypothetical protein
MGLRQVLNILHLLRSRVVTELLGKERWNKDRRTKKALWVARDKIADLTVTDRTVTDLTATDLTVTSLSVEAIEATRDAEVTEHSVVASE